MPQSYIVQEAVYLVYYILGKKNHPCSIDGTANMAAPYCGHFDNFCFRYFILNSHVRIGIYHSKTVQMQNFSTGGTVKALRLCLHALTMPPVLKFLRLDGF